MQLESMTLKNSSIATDFTKLLEMKSLKMQVCLICEKIEVKFAFKISCSCCICSEKCLKSYAEILKSKNSYICLCGAFLEQQDFLDLSRETFLFSFRDFFKKMMSSLLYDFCMFCKINYHDHGLEEVYKEVYIITFTDESLSKKLNNPHYKNFNHTICKFCFDQYSCIIKPNALIECPTCLSISHEVRKVELEKTKSDNSCIVF